jgi:YHS domain-containing protein
MFRLLGYLILALFGITLLRMVIGVVAKFFASSVAGDGGKPAGGGRRTQVPAGGVLQKDPVCGTFVPVDSSKKLTSGGETHYFCSEECMQKYREGGGKRA